VAQNPYIEFTFLARQSGTLHFHWKDDGGQTLKAEKAITVA
jgi:sulfur-oxidizing protein SoxZ